MLSTGKLLKFFQETMLKVKVPDRVDSDWLATLGYNDRLNDARLIPILKELGFIDESGKPTNLYSDYRDTSKSKEVMKEALRSAYRDLYDTFENPHEHSDEDLSNFIKNKKNLSQSTANAATRTFKILASLAGLIEGIKVSRSKQETKRNQNKIKERTQTKVNEEPETGPSLPKDVLVKYPLSFAINIQIVLPETKDTEVYNNLFAALRKFISQNEENEH